MRKNTDVIEQSIATLALGASFGEREVRRARNELMSKLHPDRYAAHSSDHVAATERAKKINNACDLLLKMLEGRGGHYSSAPNGFYGGSEKSEYRETYRPTSTNKRTSGSSGFPDPAIAEIFLISSSIVSAGYNAAKRRLYIKFKSHIVYEYFSVPLSVYEGFINAPSHGKFAAENIYSRFSYVRCKS